MSKKIGLFLFAILLISTTAMAGQEENIMSDAENRCRIWAEEDGISPNNIEDFVLRCGAEEKQISDHQFEKVPKTSGFEKVAGIYPVKIGAK